VFIRFFAQLLLIVGLRLAWRVFSTVVSQTWFETFVMLNIVLIGIATGLDLENNGRFAPVNTFVEVSAIFTTVVFTFECVAKIISEAYRPQDYFLDPDNGMDCSNFDCHLL
jgi:hypothetical protein